MKTVEEVRRERLRALQDEFGSWAAMNSRLGLGARDSTLSQCANASLGTKSAKPKTMGSELARRLEAVFEKPRGWMDTDPVFDASHQWPFEAVSRERIALFGERGIGVIEQAIVKALDDLERTYGKRTGTQG